MKASKGGVPRGIQPAVRNAHAISMICPRCGRNNPVPEATQERCLQCGFLLTNEVSRHDIRKTAARRVYLQVVLLVLIIAGVGYFGWTRNLFGLRKMAVFTVSERPSITPIIGASLVSVDVNGFKTPFSKDAEWSVDAVVLANNPAIEGTETAFAERDLVLAWGPSAKVKQKTVSVAQEGGTTKVTTSSSQIEQETFINSVAVIHALASDSTIRATLTSFKPGSKVHVSGFLVSGTVDSKVISPTTNGNKTNEPTAYLLFISDLAKSTGVLQ